MTGFWVSPLTFLESRGMRCTVAVAAAVKDLAYATMATCASCELSQHNASAIDALAGVCIYLSVSLRVVHVF